MLLEDLHFEQGRAALIKEVTQISFKGLIARAPKELFRRKKFAAITLNILLNQIAILLDHGPCGFPVKRLLGDFTHVA